MGVIRTLLAISVVITHTDPLFGTVWINGDQAINAFYMISGFYMALILERKYQDKTAAFYTNRVLRIFPPYFAALAIAIVAFAFVMQHPPYDPAAAFELFWQAGNKTAMSATALANLLIFGLDWTNFLATNPDGTGLFPVAGRRAATSLNLFSLSDAAFVPQAWTLAIELQFYIVAPLVARRGTASLAFICVLSYFISQIYLKRIHNYGFDLDGDRLFPFQFYYFAFGMLSQHLYKEVSTKKWPHGKALGIGLVAMLVAMLLIRFGRTWNNDNIVPSELFYMLMCLSLPLIFNISKDWKIDEWVGELSYPIYLFHWTFAILFRDIGDPSRRWWAEMTLLASIAFSVAYVHVIDKRVQRLRARIAANGLRIAQPMIPT